MFILRREEILRISQIVIISEIKFSRQVRAFTEQGVAMFSGILNSNWAIEVNIAIMRAFVKLREMIASHKDLSRRLDELERKYDAQFKVVFAAIRQLGRRGLVRSLKALLSLQSNSLQSSVCF
jgi:hypothetical protein